MSVSASISSPVSARAEGQSPFDFSIVPSAPRSARRCAPFVVLAGLLMYALIVVTALTGPASSGEKESAKGSTVSGQPLKFPASESGTAVG